MKDATVNPRIERLFEHTKLLCFGRYVLTVPVDSRLAFGRDFPTLPNQAKDIEKIMKAERVKILAANKTAEITYFGKGTCSKYVADSVVQEWLRKRT
jgi:hypothetical protein